MAVPLNVSARGCQVPPPGPALGRGAAGQRGERVAGVVADDRPRAGVTDLEVVLVDAGRPEAVLGADAAHQLHRARLLDQRVRGDAVVGPAQVASDGVRVGVAIPLDRLDGGLLLDTAPGPAAGAGLDLERALLLRQVTRLLVDGVAVEAVGIGQRQGALGRAR